jgi:membrane protease YdiL (CAAX protease family)
MNMKSRLFVEYLAVAAAMIALSFTPLRLAAVLVPIAYLIVESRLRKRSRKENGFDLRAAPANIKANWHLIALVAVALPLATALIGKFLLPEYFTHLAGRVTPYVSVDAGSFDKILFELLFLAFGEEIAFRVFLQGRLGMFVNPVLSIFVASAVFAGVHYSPGTPLVVVMDLASVFADSLVFGFLYKRTQNVFVTTLAHFLGNTLGIVILLFIVK